jgi:hypothetical protein
MKTLRVNYSAVIALYSLKGNVPKTIERGGSIACGTCEPARRDHGTFFNGVEDLEEGLGVRRTEVYNDFFIESVGFAENGDALTIRHFSGGIEILNIDKKLRALRQRKY